MNTSQDFYDTYHAKNDKFVKKIGFTNFTYYYLVQMLQKAYTFMAVPPAVLDVGCGVGTIALFLSDFSRAVVGIDLSRRAVEIANSAAHATNSNNAKFFVGELQNFNKLFDLVVATEIIEHVPNENDFLKKVHGSLHANGLLMLSTPLSENFLVNTKLYKNFDAEVGHLRRYTQNSITKVLRENGFRIITARKTESPLRNLLFILHLDIVIKCIKGPLIPLFHWVDELLIPFWGASNIIILAKKA